METEAQVASPEPAVFRTAFGVRIFLPLAILCLSLLVFTQLPALGGVTVAFLSLTAGIFVVYIMLSTKYRVVDGVLHMLQGPFSGSIDLESISRICLKGSMFRGTTYGLGTRGVTICYKLGVHRDRAVCVTPKDVDGFLAAIGACRTASGDVEVTR